MISHKGYIANPETELHQKKHFIIHSISLSLIITIFKFPLINFYLLH